MSGVIMSRRKTFPSLSSFAPNDDGLKGQRALTKASNHGLVAGLEALGNGDLALARQKLLTIMDCAWMCAEVAPRKESAEAP